VICIRELTKQIWKMYAFEQREEEETGKKKLYKISKLKDA
jgi:hypothetical protein